jgi:hypothetical protein
MTSGLPVAAPRTASQGGDGALPVPVQEAYVHARVPDDAGWCGSSRYRIRPCCLLLPRRHWHPGLHCFRRSQPGLHTPLSMLRVTPRGATRMTRGRRGSLPLHRGGLSPLTSCRSPGAPWLNPTPQMITVYASPWSSPSPTQHSLPGGRYPLPGPDFHRLDRASFTWRTAGPSMLEIDARSSRLLLIPSCRRRKRTGRAAHPARQSGFVRLGTVGKETRRSCQELD